MATSIIDRIKEWKDNSIWQVLDELGHEEGVFSNFYDDLVPLTEAEDTYVFAANGEFVVVLLDTERPYDADTLADEDEFNGEEPLYFEESTHRISPVYKLLEFSHALRLTARLMQKSEPTVHCLLITQVYIINYEAMLDQWDFLGVSVVHQQQDLRKRQLHVNSEVKSPEAELMTDFFNHKELLSWDLNPAFDRMPNDFVRPEPAEEEEDDEDDVKTDAFLDALRQDKTDPFDITSDGMTPQVELPEVGALRVELIPPMSRQKAQQQLDNLVGCQQLKAFISDMCNYAEYNRRLMKADPMAKPIPICLNAIFMGNPGTAKSTVAKLMGSLLRGRVLSKGHVIMTTRSTFVGQHWGAEEDRVDRVFQMSAGGVLVIDEAYMLMGAGHKEDPAKLVLPLMLSKLADEREHQDRMVILCGYSKPMKQLIETNPGLTSRFPSVNRFEFSDLNAEELVEIFHRRLRDSGPYMMTRKSRERVREVIFQAYENRDRTSFGNGRYVVNLLNAIMREHSRRIVRNNICEREKIYQITAADIKPLEMPDRGTSIGFCR